MDETTFNVRIRNEELEHWSLFEKLLKDRGISVSSFHNSLLLPLISELAKQKPNKQKTYALELGSITFE